MLQSFSKNAERQGLDTSDGLVAGGAIAEHTGVVRNLSMRKLTLIEPTVTRRWRFSGRSGFKMKVEAPSGFESENGGSADGQRQRRYQEHSGIAALVCARSAYV